MLLLIKHDLNVLPNNGIIWILKQPPIKLEDSYIYQTVV